MKLAVIIGTTRQGRVTPRLARWVQNTISEVYPAVEVRLLDLREYAIPLLDEAPWLKDRTLTEGAQRWLGDLAWADGYVFVTAEYNHGMPAVLKNALDYANSEMSRKPAAIVSHGGVSGARANEQLRLVLNSSLGAVPIPASVPFIGKVAESLTEGGTTTEIADPLNAAKLHKALDDLVWYTGALAAAK